MEDLTGKQLGRYQVTAPLGEGGMAAVYRAYQAGMDRYVALKILPRHYAADPQFVARFQREAHLVAKLQHPHILPVFDFGEADSYTYLVMPLIESGTLESQLTGEPLPVARIRTVIAQIGDALDYAHSRGLVHRDIKPSNILLDERGNCLLTDFGIAKMVEATTQLTQTGAVIGTPAYMSPEQGAGKALTPASDIYSLGVVMYEMATGRAPFEAETPVAILIKHIQDPLPPPTQFNPALSSGLERVILKTLAKQPELRYASAADLVLAVRAAVPEAPELKAARQISATAIAPAHGPSAKDVPSATAPQPEAGRAPSLAPRPALVARLRGARPWPWLGIGGVLAVGLGAFAMVRGGAVAGNPTYATEPLAAATALANTTATETSRATAVALATGLARIHRNATATALAVPTTTSTASPTVHPAASWPVLLLDGFEDNANGWHLVANEDDGYSEFSRVLRGGVFAWEATPRLDSNLMVDFPSMSSVSDVYASVDARRTGRAILAIYGLAFRASSSPTGPSYYSFNVSDYDSGDAVFAIVLVYEGFWSYLIDSTRSDAIRPGQVNNLKVIAEGEEFTFFINSQQVAQIRDDRLEEGRVGLFTQSWEMGETSKWEFDNFELRAP